ncbi:MAG: hypothetical protein LAN63_14480 [Acidobacteriia bacterium]|nr:hypothetical protein [Terriglobia bacterium]
MALQGGQEGGDQVKKRNTHPANVTVSANVALNFAQCLSSEVFTKMGFTVTEATGLRVVELEALLELREHDEKRMVQAISDFPDPRTRAEFEKHLLSIEMEIESIRRELRELTLGQNPQLGPNTFFEESRREDAPAQA